MATFTGTPGADTADATTGTIIGFTVSGGSGNTCIDHFVGGAGVGADTIAVGTNGGTDYFYDYQDGSDKISVVGTGLTAGTLWVNTGGVGTLDVSDFVFV